MIEIWTDGSNTKDGSKTRSSWVIKRDGELIEKDAMDGFAGWSDVAEYIAILRGMWRLECLGLQDESIAWYCDNLMVVRQLSHEMEIKQGKYVLLAYRALEALEDFPRLKFKWIPREQNKEADALATFRKGARK